MDDNKWMSEMLMKATEETKRRIQEEKDEIVKSIISGSNDYHLPIDQVDKIFDEIFPEYFK